jgi:hypothetical protein
MKALLLTLGLAIIVGLGAVWLYAAPLHRTSSPTPAVAPRQTGRPVPFTTLDKGQYSRLLSVLPSSSDLVLRTDDPAVFYLIISDRSTWQHIWSTNQGLAHNDLPEINFTNNTIVVIILGPSGGAAGVNITAVSAYPDHIELSLDHIIDEHASPSLAVITHPYQIVSLPKLDKPLSLVVRRLSSKRR